MSKDLDAMLKEAPTLTFDPFEGEKAELSEVKVQAKEKEPEAIQVVLTEKEQDMVDSFAAQIDITDTRQVLQYGAGSQKKIAEFSETALDNVRTKDMGEVGQMLTEVVAQLRDFDEEEEKGFLGLFKRGGNKLANIKAKYEKAENNVNKIRKASDYSFKGRCSAGQDV